jgi:hypothetical protein
MWTIAMVEAAKRSVVERRTVTISEIFTETSALRQAQ